jgi:hypothetical protein
MSKENQLSSSMYKEIYRGISVKNFNDINADFGNYTEYGLVFGKSFINIPMENHSEISNITLYIPVLTGDNGFVYVCPNVSSLEDINESCLACGRCVQKMS